MNPLSWLGERIALYLQKPSGGYRSRSTCSPDALLHTIKKGDVLLVDGVSRVSQAIKYLTQSTWSHAALCIADQYGCETPDMAKVLLLEADVVEGVRIIPLSEYANQDTRICRPVGLQSDDIDVVVEHAKSQLGHQYDTKNVFDLARYLIQTPPVPVRWRRNMLSLGSGDPTRAICSSLVAQAFHRIKYPILPEAMCADLEAPGKIEVFFQVRHHTLFVPRDFDISPYFQIIKPSLEREFNPFKFAWHDEESDV
ncbi:YiiX/YebB-like N1pC/P60 family cysteine hydrolase [Aliiglaciecola sp. LCG003]|uniref:YiiX/YebB-like N1pC/P60 family cysteine hydrolase n=1 Tax=Aliiglaciecola sp. LCG003 TaxID=3053655 RepID=UPI00257393BA|nr:YiiX/YebB-like N1pC/P60 family cysteine hydrolase [Aliiglaciecola sp. LCG003]WJG10827.1 YiiX/YebB-like N1pC/P60 family cysteine hydrolase [Aliiglaciecola sp. LCG003]